MKFSDQRQIGVIAQEVELVFPEVVDTNEDGYKSVDYSRLTPILLEAIKEQQLTIADLIAKNKELESKVNTIESLISRLDRLESNMTTQRVE